jgi:hypothetical protein
LSQFLLQMVISNTIAESRHLISAFGLDAADIMELLTQLEDLGFPKWNWGGIRLFGLGEGLVVVSENPLSEGDLSSRLRTRSGCCE